MVFTNAGANVIRDLFSAALTDATLGEDGTSAKYSDTALGTPDATTNDTTSNSTADKQVNVDFTLPSTTGNGTTYEEFGTFNSTDSLFSRQSFAPLTKSSADQWQISVIYKFNN